VKEMSNNFWIIALFIMALLILLIVAGVVTVH